MKKLLLLLALVLSCGLASFAETVTDILTASIFGVTGTGQYNDYSWTSKETGVKYAGQFAKDKNNALQLRSKNSNSGIVITENTNGYKIVSIKCTVSSGSKTWNVYADETAYTSASQLYAIAANGNKIKGTSIGSNNASATIEFTGKNADKFEFAGIRSQSGALYLTSVEITYETGAGNVKDPAGLEYKTTEFTVEVGEEFTAPELVNPNNLAVTYDSSDKTVATVDAEGKVTVLAVGTTTITATSAETETYKKGEASYTLTVTPANVVYNADFTVDEVFTFEQSGSYPWSWDKTYGLKGSAYVSGKANATDVVAASAVIDLTNRVAPIEFTINHALNQYKLNNVLIDVAEVGEYAKIVARVEGETEWTEVAVPEVTEFSWTYFNQTINLDQFSGKKIQIGFRYISTAQIAGTWEIKTVTLTAPKGTPAPVAPAAPVVTMGEKTVTVTVEEGCTAYYKFVMVNDQPAIETFALEAGQWYAVENNTIDLTKLPETTGNEKLQITVKAVNADGAESEEYTTEPFSNPGGTVGITDIEADNSAAAEYYNLQGVRMDGELTPGLYIRRQGNKATKVIVK